MSRGPHLPVPPEELARYLSAFARATKALKDFGEAMRDLQEAGNAFTASLTPEAAQLLSDLMKEKP